MAIPAPIAAAALGDNTVVAAVAGKKIRVKSWSVSNLPATAQAIKWKSGAGTDLTGLWGIGAAIGLIGAQDLGPPDFCFETAAGQALVLNLAAATAVGGVVQYTLE